MRIRNADASDAGAVFELCRRIDPGDYVPRAWPDWLAGRGNVDLVAEAGGRIVGFVHAGRVSPTEVFSQGLRVDPAWRRRGIGERLMRLQNQRLCERGVTCLRGTTGIDNHRARRLFAAIGMRQAAAVIRRRCSDWEGRGPSAATPTLAAARALIRRHRLLASRPGIAHFRRVYRSPTDSWIARIVAAGRIFSHHEAVAVVDPPGAVGRLWVAALAGPAAAVDRLLAGLRSAAGRSTIGLTVDAPADPEIQALLDRLGFDPSGGDGRYVVLEGSPEAGLPDRC